MYRASCSSITRRYRRRWLPRKVLISLLLTIYIGVHATCADTSFQTRAHYPCEESEPPFDSSSCTMYTQYAALVDLIGGGAATQLIKVVGSRTTPLVNLVRHEDGTIVCPPGTACVPVDVPDLKVSIIRSPLPKGMPRIMPHGGVSLGFYWKLTRNNHYSPDYRIPYAYKVAKCSGAAPHSTCYNSTTRNNVRFHTFDPFDSSTNEYVNEPACAASCDSAGYDMRGTCGTNVPSPTGYLSDSDGRCSELCCGNTTSVKVRQLAPYCYVMSAAAAAPGIAVDFAVTVESAALGLKPIVVPVYGVSDPQSIFVNERGVRVRILSLVHELERFDHDAAFSVVHGSVVVCPTNYTRRAGTSGNGDHLPGAPLFPNEVGGPVANVSDIDWFYMPSAYVPFYRDATAAESAQIIRPSSAPTQHAHQKLFGESGSVVEQAAANYINSVYNSTPAAVQRCRSLQDVLPFVPGYDVDEPLTDASRFELPSPCEMWSQARLGNRAFLPPAFNVAKPNWFIRRGIANGGRDANATFDPNDLYLVFVPSEQQIEQVNAERALMDAMLMSVEMSDNVLPYKSGGVQVPVTISSNGTAAGGGGGNLLAPTCSGPIPQDNVGSFTAKAIVRVTLRSALDNPLADGESPAPITVSIMCSTSYGDNVPVYFGGDGGTKQVTLAYQQQVTLQFDATFTFSEPYNRLFGNGEQIGSCVAVISGASSGNGQLGPIGCSAGPTLANPSRDEDPHCSFFDVNCQHDEEGKRLIDIGAVQMAIGLTIGFVALIVMIVVIGVVAKRNYDLDEHRVKDNQKKSAVREVVTARAQQLALKRAKEGKTMPDRAPSSAQ